MNPPVPGEPRRPAPFDLARVHARSRTSLASLAHREGFARTVDAEATAAAFFDSLPRLLAGARLRDLVEWIVTARRNDRPVILGLGPHVIKVGCSPLVVDLLERGIITGIAANGAAPIHDYEVARFGATSEDVVRDLEDGSFGFGKEAVDFFHRGLARAGRDRIGLGQALGEALLEEDLPHRADSIFATCARLGWPATVHVTLGADTVHMHPEIDAALLGEASMTDFRILCAEVAGMDGGVYLNVGSAVVLPELFLKAVSVARNTGHPLADLRTANLDQIQHYRPRVNVIERPAAQGIAVTGHHEILLPLLRIGLLARLGRG